MFQSPCGGIGASDLQENLLNHLNILDSFNHLAVAGGGLTMEIMNTIGKFMTSFNHLTVAGVGQT